MDVQHHKHGSRCHHGRYVMGGATQPPYTFAAAASSPYLSKRCTQWRDWADWRWDSPHCLDPLSIAYYDVCPWIRRRRVFFVGDSTQFEMYVSMIMLAGGRGDVLTRNASTSWQGHTIDGLCNGSTTLTWARADFLQQRGEASPLNLHGQRQRGFSNFYWSDLAGYDVVVLNMGIHMTSDQTIGQRADKLARRFATMLHANKTLIWRTTVPGHDNCSVSSQRLLAPYEPATTNIYGWQVGHG